MCDDGIKINTTRCANSPPLKVTSIYKTGPVKVIGCYLGLRNLLL